MPAESINSTSFDDLPSSPNPSILNRANLIPSQESRRERTSCFTKSGTTEQIQKLDIEDGETRPNTHSRRIRIFLEAIGLSILYNLLGKIFNWDLKEQKKVVMDHSRVVAAVRCLIHIIPAGICIGLVYLNLINLYLGSELPGQQNQDPQKLAALQFAAKLHELLMLSSLGVILITHIRRELTFGDGIPFGVLFSGQQFNSISILWSLELWGAVYRKWRRRRKKGFILSLIIVCSILGLSVGPSSATLMRPRLAYWAAGGTPFWVNATSDTLFPTAITDSPSLLHCMVQNDDLSCPSGGWQILNRNLFSSSTYMTGIYKAPDNFDMFDSIATRSILVRSRSNRPKHVWDKITFATVPSSFVADSIARLAQLWTVASDMASGNVLYSLENFFNVNLYQPVVITRCVGNSIEVNNTLQFNFAVMDSQLLEFNSTSDVPDQTSAVQYQLSDNATLAAIKSALLPGALPSLHWLDLPDLLNQTKSSLNAVAVVPIGSKFDPSYFCCSIEIPFPNATASSDHRIQHITGFPDQWLQRTTYSADVPLLYPTAGWAKYLSAPIQSDSNSNSTVFSSMASTAAQWDYRTSSMSQYPEISIEAILTTLLINGIGRLNYNASILLDGYLQMNPSEGSNVPIWMSKILPRNLNLGPGDNIFEIPPQVQAQSTMLLLQATNYGYAYTSAGATQKAALIVLLCYVLLAFIHSSSSIWSGWSSSTWGSLSEITALGINSASDGAMRNTGAGIHTITVYEKNVQIDAKQDELQLVFEVPQKANQVQPNTPYG